MDEGLFKFENGIMKISIIIPVYNVAPYVEECLNSVITQTYKGEMECILVDDCGTDDSVTICERIISRYNGPINFRIVHHVHNRGLSAARNTGIDASTGDWLYFLDSDDSIIPECLELMVGCLEMYPDSEMVFAGAKSSDGSLEYMMNYENRYLPPYSNNPRWIKRAMLFNVLNVTAWNKLIRKDVIINSHCFFVEGLIHEDEMWNFELATIVKKVAICRHNTYLYQIRNNSIMRMVDNMLIFNNRQKLLLAQIDHISLTDNYYQVKKIWQEIIFLCQDFHEDYTESAVKLLFEKLTKYATYSMLLVAWFSYFMPYSLFKTRIVTWLLSKLLKKPKEVPAVI